MIKITKMIAVGALLCMSFTATAGNWYDKYDRGHKRSFKQTTEYNDGNCKVKRKYKKDGSYTEKRKCKKPSYGRDYRSENRHYRNHRNDAVDLLPAIIEPFIRAMN